MRDTITVSIPKKIKKEVDRITRVEGLTRSEIIRQSLQDYLFTRKFRALRNKMKARAQAQGIGSDEDVFSRVS